MLYITSGIASTPSAPSEGPPPFLRNVREGIRVRGFTIRTEEAYVHWLKRFMSFRGKRHPTGMCEH